MTTATVSTPRDVRERLQALLEATAEYASACERMQAIADELTARDTDVLEEAGFAPLRHFVPAVRGQVTAACHAATYPEEYGELSQVSREVEEAIEILDLAIERSDDAR